MTEAHLFVIGLLLAWLAGIRAYLTVFGIGLAGLMGWVDLPPALHATESYWVLGTCGVLAIAGAITRVLALPGVEQFLQRFLPWLAASARGDEEPLPAGTDLDQITGSGTFPIADEHEPTQSPARE